MATYDSGGSLRGSPARIREAEETGAVELDLNFLALNRLPPELASLPSLQSLSLHGCMQLSGDLSRLAGLTSLQSLTLYECESLSGDLSPLTGLTSLQSLNLHGCKQLSGNLSPLSGLTSLQSLDLHGCMQLSGDLAPLASLTSLQWLNLAYCGQLSDDLAPLAALESLQSLNLSGSGIRQFTSLEPLLARLKELYLYRCRFDDLPSEICGQGSRQNVIREVRAHFNDLKAGRELDAELKNFILGNGSVGKTQLARRLQGLNFDERIPTTHGIELNFIRTNVDHEHFKGPVRLNLWDFGGQDIYHGSHTLFLHGHAIFLLLWKKEEATDKADSKHQPITYWLDYLRAVAGPDNPLIVCQSQCDKPEMRAPVPVGLSNWAGSSWTVEVSAKTDFGLGRLEGTLKDAAWACLQRSPPPIGKGRLMVRGRLRQMLSNDQLLPPTQRRHRLLERQAFDQLCAEIGEISDTEALLGFLHHNGVVFYRSGLFKNQIILDQNWALEAIYSIFHRDKCFKQLKKLHGRFNREDLELLIWKDYTPAEQQAFLGMMESCGICFKVRDLPNYEWEYIAPYLLPTRLKIH